MHVSSARSHTRGSVVRAGPCERTGGAASIRVIKPFVDALEFSQNSVSVVLRHDRWPGAGAGTER